MSGPIIRLEAVCKDYGAIKVLRNLSFDVQPGEAFAIIGPNGAGKTTMFRVLTGEVPINAGRISYAGQDISSLREYQRSRLGIGRTFQTSRVFPEMSALANMVVAIESRHNAPRVSWYKSSPHPNVLREAHERLSEIGLATKSETGTKFLSHGDKKRLEFSMMLARAPKVLMMDEPVAGMSPADRQETIALLKAVRSEQKQTLLLTEHDMDVVFDLADRILVMSYGEQIALGTPEEIRQNPAVRDVYLGQELDIAFDQ